MKRVASSTRPCSMRRPISSRLALIACSMLLKSCAIPPVSWPTASILCDCRNASSTRPRSAASARSRSSASASSRVRAARPSTSTVTSNWLAKK